MERLLDRVIWAGRPRWRWANDGGERKADMGCGYYGICLRAGYYNCERACQFWRKPWNAPPKPERNTCGVDWVAGDGDECGTLALDRLVGDEAFKFSVADQMFSVKCDISEGSAVKLVAKIQRWLAKKEKVRKQMGGSVNVEILSDDVPCLVEKLKRATDGERMVTMSKTIDR